MNTSKILIINPYGIGDVLFTTPLITNLRAAYPTAKIAYLSNSRTAHVLELNPDIAKVFIYDRDEFKAVYRQNKLSFIRKILSFYQSIKNEGFDTVIDLSLNSGLGFLCMACGIKERIGFDYRGRGRFLTHRIPLNGYEGRHVVEYYLDLLQVMEVPIVSRSLTFNIPASEHQWAVQWLARHKIDTSKQLIAVLPGGGASWGHSAGNKRWPAANFAHLIDKIVEKSDAVIILMGDPAEKELCEEVSRQVHFSLYSAAGETSLLGLAALLARCKTAIVNDGGPLHVASAIGVKTVSIFGPVDPKVYGPYPWANHIVIQKGLPCQPCYRCFRMAGCAHINCLATLSVDEVYRKVQGIL